MATANKRRQLGRQVSIVGAGLSQFGAFATKDSRDLFVEAFQNMVENIDRGFDIPVSYTHLTLPTILRV